MNFFHTESPLRDSASSTSTISDRPAFSKTLRDTPKVFIVDADEAACESLAALFTREGWSPETFASGEEFLAHSIELAPGCLILDVSLPGLSGLELQKHAIVKCSAHLNYFSQRQWRHTDHSRSHEGRSSRIPHETFSRQRTPECRSGGSRKESSAVCQKGGEASPSGALYRPLTSPTAGHGVGVFRITKQTGRRGTWHQ